MRGIRYRSAGPAETMALAARLAAYLQPGDVISLTGELGSGKTEFVRGLARGLGVPEEVPVASPSFALAHEYPGRLALVHLDLYRLERLTEELLPDLEGYLFGPRVAAVEWAERLGDFYPRDCLEVALSIAGETERLLTVTGRGERGRQLLAEIAAIWGGNEIETRD